MINNIQLLRGLAALGVVYYHTHFQIFKGVMTDFYGVSIFFVLSGFIITHVTRTDDSNFLLKRAIRVVPLYWLTTALFFLATSFGFLNPLYTIPTWWTLAGHGSIYLGAWFSAQASSVFTADAGWQLLLSFLFWPAERPPVLGVGWTLNYEIFFYLLFAAALTLSRRWAPLLAIIALMASQLLSRAVSCGPVCSTYGNGVTTYFAQGIVIYYIWQHLRARMPNYRKLVRLAALATATILVAVCIGWPDKPDILPYFLAPAVVLVALLAEEAGLRCQNRALLVLGDISYSLYLTHLMVVETMRTIGSKITWLDHGSNVIALIISLAASIGLAILVHYWIERPMIAGLRKLGQVDRSSHVRLSADPRSSPS